MMVHDEIIFMKRFIKINRRQEGNTDANQRAWRYKAMFLTYRSKSGRKDDSF
jgi:hypothetical protein